MDMLEVERAMLKLAAATIAPLAERLSVLSDLPADAVNPLIQILVVEDQLNAARNLLFTVKVGLEMREQRDRAAMAAFEQMSKPPQQSGT